MSNLSMIFITTLLAASSAFSQSLGPSDLAEDRIREISKEIQNLSPSQKTIVEKQMQALSEVSGESQWSMRPMSTLDQQIHPFICVGAQSGALISVVAFKCVSSQNTSFDLSVIGIRRAFITSGNIALGFSRGPIQEGFSKMKLEAGGYLLAGASVFSSETVSLLAPGLGLGFHLGWKKGMEPLLGGDIFISLPKSEL